MNETELLGEGVELMLVGMGTVFTFLILLVTSTHLMSSAIRRFLPDAAPTPGAGQTTDGETELLAVVTAAITAFRKDKTQKDGQ